MGKLLNSFNNALANTIVSTKKHSPEILLASGIGLGVVSCVMACVATTKVKDVTDKSKKEIEEIHEESFTDSKKNRQLTIAYSKAVLNYAKLYTPSVIVGSLAITSVLASNNILRKRNVALAAAYTAVDTAFKKYRERVIDKFGEEVDNELRYGVKEKEITETIIDENGKEKKVKKKVKVLEDGCSEFAVYYDSDTSVYYEDNMDYNTMIINAKQNYLNDILKCKKSRRVTLNEVYDALGLPETKAGMVVGWIYDPKRKDDGDNYIEIKAQRVYRKDGDDPEKYHECLLLDFNVDGNVYDLSK